MWVPARARVQEEVRDMAALAAKEGANITIEPWDYRHYAEKVRKDRFDVDENAVKPYLQLDKLREGMFWAAEELFGYRFTPDQPGTVPVFHPEVQVWSVNMADGKPLGLFYFDPYARNGKLSGAWMTQYRNQERFDGEILTLVSNNSNFVRGQPGEPVLLSWDDATTLFHEFGHALHGLSSNVTYPGVSGTSVPSDYVELPSQILEHWLPEPRLLDRYALHFETGLPMPKDLVEKVEKASNFNQGFFTLEFLASALVDMKLHMDPNPPTDIQAAEKRILDQLGMPREIVMRHRTTQFNHLFSSDDYSAGYYSYLWADTLVADAWEAFEQAPGGAWDKELAGRLYANVFSVGNIIDPAEGYRAFRGKDPTFEALMRQRGFAPPAPKAP
jgi:peptidyl-dipeptidase Dcp